MLKWEADEEVANKELDAKLKQVAEVRAAQAAEIKMLEQGNANLRRHVAVAEQKKEEVKKKALFASRKAEVLLDQFNIVAAEVERVHTRPPCEEVLYRISKNVLFILFPGQLGARAGVDEGNDAA